MYYNITLRICQAIEEKKAELYTYEFDAGTKAKLRQQWEEAHQEFMKNRNSMDAGSGSWNNYAESQEYTKLLEEYINLNLMKEI